MDKRNSNHLSRSMLFNNTPKSINVSENALVKTIEGFPLKIEAGLVNMDLIGWAKNNYDFIESNLSKHGALLFRGFTTESVNQFEQFTSIFTKSLASYKERSTPRTEVQNKIYTSTEYPQDFSIPMHNENSYAANWPRKIWFYCAKSALTGGETPIVDSRKVFQRLDNKIKNRFIEKKVMYVRNYGQKLDLPWQTVFQTSSKEEVEQYCRNTGMKYEWKDDGSIKTYAVRPAYATHPETKENVWFNQAHLFHVSGLPTEVRDTLLASYKEEELPRNTYYGDGTPIEQSVLEEINAVYDELSVSFQWHEGDILMLDNMLVAHGRSPFTGDRKILVAMADPINDYGY